MGWREYASREREAARIEEVDGRRGSESQPAESPLSKRPPLSPLSQPGVDQAVADRQRGTRLYFLQPPHCGGLRRTSSGRANRPSCQNTVWKGKKIAAKKIDKKILSSRALLDRELEHGERRDGVVDEEVLRCGLNKDKSWVAEQADSTDKLSPLQGDEGSIWRWGRSHTVTALGRGLLQLGDNWIVLRQKFFSWRERMKAITDQVKKLWDSRHDMSDLSLAMPSLIEMGR